MKQTIKGLLSLALLATMAACSGGGGGGGSSTSPSLTISGNLASSMILANGAHKARVGELAVALSDLEIYVIAFSNPPTIGKADVAASGAFSVTLPVSSAPITALFREKANPMNTVGQIVFQDPAIKDLSGNTKDLSTVSLSGSTSLGNISLSDDGKIVIPVTQIASTNTTSTTVAGFDFTGTYKAAPYPTSGFITAGESCGDEPCIPVDTPITLMRLVGKEFTKNGSCVSEGNCPDSAGTIGTNEKYGISVWDGGVGNGSPLHSCGYRIGVTPDDARYGGGIHLTSGPVVGGQTMLLQAFSFSSLNTGNSENSSNNDAQPWMKPGAKAQYPMQDCSNIVQNGLKLSVCKMKADKGDGSQTDLTIYSAGSQGGGCVEDGTGKPLNVNNWNAISPDGHMCDNEQVSGFPGLSRNSCHYTNQAPDSSAPSVTKSFTCTHTGGMFSTFSSNTLSNPTTDWLVNFRPESAIAQNADCDSLSYDKNDPADNGKRLAVYRCYAQNYDRHDGNGCTREYTFNWGTNDPNQFAHTSGRGKPSANFVVDLLTYSADGNTFFVDAYSDETVAITGMNNGMTFCSVERNQRLTGAKTSGTQLLMTVTQSGRLTTLDPACVAAANGPDTWENGNLSYLVGGEKLIFLMNKQ